MAETTGAVVVEPGPVHILGCRLLEAASVPAAAAALVMDHLVEASAMGLHSHGLMRLPQYLGEIARGAVDPGAMPAIERAAPGVLRVDGGNGLGQVMGMAMVAALDPIVREQGIAIAVGRRLGHTGRVGAYPEAMARQGLIGIALCSGPASGHWVAPFGGREGRISTNPMAFAWPVAGDRPVVADFSTAATAEGVVRSLHHRGLRVPEGMLRDADGRPTDDPGVLYATPKGAIQPMGGPVGYRGTALALLAEVLTTLAAGESIDEPDRRGTDMTLVGIEPGSSLASLAAGMGHHIRATAPIDPDRPVLMPGDREAAAAARAERLLVDGPTWSALVALASDHALETPAAAPA